MDAGATSDASDGVAVDGMTSDEGQEINLESLRDSLLDLPHDPVPDITSIPMAVNILGS